MPRLGEIGVPQSGLNKLSRGEVLVLWLSLPAVLLLSNQQVGQPQPATVGMGGKVQLLHCDSAPVPHEAKRAGESARREGLSSHCFSEPAFLPTQLENRFTHNLSSPLS